MELGVMRKNKGFALPLVILIVLVLVGIGALGYFYFSRNRRMLRPGSRSGQSISGGFRGDQTWSGEILITGDVGIDGNLTILPGTIVRFVVGDDQILFTSAAEKPDYADWVSLGFGGDGSIVEYCIVEWSRNSITPGRNQPNTKIRNNIIKNTFWGAIGGGFSGARIENNEIWEAGHEGIDVQGGNPIIENNVIHNAQAGIVILSGSATVKNNTMINVGDGIHVGKGSTPILENNLVEEALHNFTKEWRYGNFAYKMREEK
jgi:parallel beta-helix repeat protein